MRQPQLQPLDFNLFRREAPADVQDPVLAECAQMHSVLATFFEEAERLHPQDVSALTSSLDEVRAELSAEQQRRAEAQHMMVDLKSQLEEVQADAGFRSRLPAIGLPGARLLPNFRVPGEATYSVTAKGDGSYNSVAVAVQRKFASYFSFFEDVGSNRRLWAHVVPASGHAFLWLTFYLPANDDDAWKSELLGIEADVHLLIQKVCQNSTCQYPLLLMGDANLQPSSLGKGRDPKPQREALWEQVLRKLGLTLLNPAYSGEPASAVSLPLRHRVVHVCPCDTHHCNGGPGTSRAIDLVISSPEIFVDILIHNGVHCKNSGCSWDLCVEFTKGDHFLIEVQLPEISVSGDRSAWQEEELWKHGVQAASPCLDAFMNLLAFIISQAQIWPRKTAVKWREWIADACVLFMCTIESLVRDAWVLFAGVNKRCKRRRRTLHREIAWDTDCPDQLADAIRDLNRDTEDMTAGLRDGALALLGSIMEKDIWRISLSGDSFVSTTEGIPEGSKYGPPCFNLLPNTLVKKLQAEQCGIAIAAEVPQIWKNHVWTGRGEPDPSLTRLIVQQLRCQSNNLPGADTLSANATVEASCARALDLVSDCRIPVLFHADDPVFLASSRGEANRLLRIISSWCSKYKASLHLSAHKTVAMVFPEQPVHATLKSVALKFFPHGNVLPSPVHWANTHKWLGVTLTSSGCMAAHVTKCCCACSCAVQVLCALVKAERIPLAIACVIFNLKIEPVLRFARWLWGMDEEALQISGNAYNHWARLLLGMPPYRNAEICKAELGWNISVEAQAVYEAALVRKAFWLQSHETLAGYCFCQAHTTGTNNWAQISLARLEHWRILDWPVWAAGYASVKPTDAVIFLYVHRESSTFRRAIEAAASSWKYCCSPDVQQDPFDFRCEVCHVSTRTAADFAAHNAGKIHRKRVALEDRWEAALKTSHGQLMEVTCNLHGAERKDQKD
eukprot:s2414_g9.t1